MSDAGSVAALEAFTMHLGMVLHRFGTPAHQLEDVMQRVARRYGVPSHFLSTPTSITASFGIGSAQKLYMARVEHGEMNLEKLSLLEELSYQVISGSVPLDVAYGRIDHIVASPKRFGPLGVVGAFAVASGAVARLFEGGWPEIIVAGVIGLCIGSFAALNDRFPTWARIFEMASALLAALVAAAAGHILGPYALHTATLAGIIILLPGMTVTTGMTELSTGNLVSGTARLMGAAVTFMKLGFGVALGTRIGQTWFGTEVEAPPFVAPWTLWPALLIAALALAIILQARPRDLIWIVAISSLGTVGSQLGTWAVGSELAPFIAALLVTAGSNVYARLSRRAAAVTQVPSILLLVPGSVGYRSVAALLERNVLSGLETGFSMILTATALVAGILLANLMLPARRVL